MLIDDVWITPGNADHVAKETGNHRKTVLKWIREKRLPRAIHKLLRLLLHGDVGLISDEWHGWKLCPRSGKLFAPEGGRLSWDPGRLRAFQLRYHEMANMKLINKQLKAERDELLDTLSRSEQFHFTVEFLKPVLDPADIFFDPRNCASVSEGSRYKAANDN